jgi:hypothetical protein
MAGYWMGVLLHEIAYERKLRGHGMTMASEFLASRDGFNLDADRELVSDPVNQPAHYRGHASGVECITITEHMGFNLGNAVKYIWRCDLKKDAIEDLEKAEWYIRREIEKRKKAAA